MIKSTLSSFLIVATFLAQYSFAAVTINGAGATFPEPIYTKWFSEFHQKKSEAQINYQGIGSGGGIRQVIAGTVDFGATDEPMKAEEEAKVKGAVVHIPTVIGAVVLCYNLDVTKTLNFTGDVVGKIYTGEIKTWNDPAIVALNPGVKLPTSAIAPAFRSDASGTTAVFTDYISKVSPSFKAKVGQGKSVSWPVGVGGKGNAGVAGLVQQGLGTIGYVELVYALQNNMKFTTMKNKAGKFIEASVKSSSASAGKSADAIIKANYKLSINDADGADAYPITSLTWLILPKEMAPEKSVLMKEFMNWALGDAGQKMASDLGYAPLPKTVAAAALKTVNQLWSSTPAAASTPAK